MGSAVRNANPLQRLRRRARGQAWAEVAAAYLERPLDFWGADKPRHADKLTTKKQALARREDLAEADVIDAVLQMADRRSGDRPAPVYVTGLGGSGSHWVAGMLGDLGALTPAGEVYYPKALLTAMEALDDADQATVIDAVHLLHAWPRDPDVASSGIVNNAAGIAKAPTWKRWDPAAVVFHLVRDPRDQVMSVTYRKQGFRRYEDPEASDTEYLQRMTRRNARSYREYLAVADHVDVQWRYEDLCADPRPMLRQIRDQRRLAADEAVVEQVAVTHHADTIRAGGGTRVSNLDSGGRSRPWHELADAVQHRVLHLALVDAVHGLGYAPGDCMGMALPDKMGMTLTERQAPARRLTWSGDAPGPAYRRETGRWHRLPGVPGVEVDAGVAVLARIGADDPGTVADVTAFDPSDVQVLCLAGNAEVDDAALDAVATLTGLVTLDLAGTAVTDAGLRALESLTGLLQLHLDETRTTPQGRRALIEQLPNLTIRP
jgi:hypothetical protein